MFASRRVLASRLSDLGLDLHIVLVQPHTPWNAGSVGRTCLGYNATLHLVGPLGFSLEEKYVRQSGLDYWHRVPKNIWEDWESFQAQDSLLSHDFGVDIPPPDSSGEKHSVGLFFGCESKGLYDIIGASQMEDGHVLVIPMNENPDAGFRSFNLSCTVSMVVWDVYKCYYKAHHKVINSS